MKWIRTNYAQDVFAALLLYAAVIIYQGYQYGQSDQSQILPVLYAQDHPGTFAKDHYVNAYLSSGVNERTIFHFLLRHSGYDHPWIVFIWHALSAIALILAWIRIAGLYIKNKGLQWLAIGLILTIGFHTNTGSNEIYYYQLVPSLVAKAFASWGLYFWIKEKFQWWSILLIIAGYLQPLVGLQLFIVTSAALLTDKIIFKSSVQYPWRWTLIYLLATLPWIVLLALNNGGQDDPKAFIDVLEFRLSHHFFASYFHPVHILLSVLFFIIALFFYKGRLKWMVVFIAAGCIIYAMGAEVIKSPLIVYTQWWKTTLWVEALAFVALAAFLEKKLLLQSFLSKMSITIPLVFLLIVAFYRLSGIRGEKPLYMAPLSQSRSDEVEISEKAKELTSPDALFVIPPEITSFRWYSQRSAFVDYKAMLHTETFLYDWADRINRIYQYNMQQKAAGNNVYQQADNVLSNPTPQILAEWRSLGITHFISTNKDIPALVMLGRNETYAVYEIPK